MREILFRGKVIESTAKEVGEWVYGHLVVRKDYDDEPERCFICEEGHRFIRCISKMPCTYEIDPETVGEYIGLKDRNGNQIFEGDLLRFYSDLRGGLVGEPCTVRYGAFNCTCCEGVYGWEFDNGDIRDVGYYEAIGKIHSNSELIAN